jgi:hypothetical protein
MRSESVPLSSPSPLDSFDALRRWADYHVAVQKQRGRAEGWFRGPLSDSSACAPVDPGSAVAAWLASLSDGLAAMRERGDLRLEADPDALASALLAALQGGILLSRVKRDSAPLQVALDVMLDRVRSFATHALTEFDHQTRRH